MIFGILTIHTRKELKRLSQWIASVHIVKVYCCRNFWIRRLVEEILPVYLQSSSHKDELAPLLSKTYFLFLYHLSFQAETVGLIEKLGSFNLEACELKSILRFLHKSIEKVGMKFSLFCLTICSGENMAFDITSIKKNGFYV